MAPRGRPRTTGFGDDVDYGGRDEVFVERLAEGFDSYSGSLRRNAEQKRLSARATQELRQAEQLLQRELRGTTESPATRTSQTERQARAYKDLATQIGRVTEEAKKANQALKGEVLLFSGFRNADLKKQIEEAGGRVVSQFSSRHTLSLIHI